MKLTSKQIMVISGACASVIGVCALVFSCVNRHLRKLELRNLDDGFSDDFDIGFDD